MKKITVSVLMFVIIGLFFPMATGAEDSTVPPLNFVSELPGGQVGVNYLPALIIEPMVGCAITGAVVDEGLPLPTGMVVSADGYVTGVPTQEGTFPVGWVVDYTCVEGSATAQSSSSLTILAGVTNTGEKVAEVGRITVVSADSILVNNVVVKITNKTIVLPNKRHLRVGRKVGYYGTRNTDGSVNAVLIAVL